MCAVRIRSSARRTVGRIAAGALVASGVLVLAPTADAATTTSFVTLASENGDSIGDGSAAGSHTVALSSSGRFVGKDSQLPANPEPGATPGINAGSAPVTELTAKPDADSVALTWRNPDVGSEWAETVVRGAPGITPPATAQDGFEVYRGRLSDAVAPDLEPNISYSFAAVAIGVAGLEAQPAVVTVNGATVTASVSTSRVTYGDETVITGRIRDAANGQPLEYVDFQVLAHRPGAGEEFFGVGQDLTRAGGTFAFPVAAPETYEFLVVFLGDESHLGGVAVTRVVSVAFSVFAKPLAKAGKLGKTFTIVVGVDPFAKRRPVVVEEFVQGTWRKVRAARLDKESIAKIKVRPRTKGTHIYRVHKAAGPRHLAGTSKKVKVRVT